MQQRRYLELEERPLDLPVETESLLHRAVGVVSRQRTRGHFAYHFAPKVGAELVENNLLTLLSWMQAEGDAGRFNPLNTTWEMPGSTTFNFAHVQNYLTFDDGVIATAKTLNAGAKADKFGYHDIRNALHRKAHPRITLEAIERSSWGTGGLALRVFEDTDNEVILATRFHWLAQ